MWVSFCQKTATCFITEFYLKMVDCKNVSPFCKTIPGFLKIDLCIWYLHIFIHWPRGFDCLYYFSPEATISKKNRKKNLKGHFVVEQNTIKNVKTPYKSDQPEANVKTNCRCNAKRTHPKERYFATNYLNFWEIKYISMNLLEILVLICPLISVWIMFKGASPPGIIRKSEDYIKNCTKFY